MWCKWAECLNYSLLLSLLFYWIPSVGAPCQHPVTNSLLCLPCGHPALCAFGEVGPRGKAAAPWSSVAAGRWDWVALRSFHLHDVGGHQPFWCLKGCWQVCACLYPSLSVSALQLCWSLPGLPSPDVFLLSLYAVPSIISYPYFVFVAWIFLHTTYLFFEVLLFYASQVFRGCFAYKQSHSTRSKRKCFLYCSNVNHFPFAYDVSLTNLSNCFDKHLKDLYCSHFTTRKRYRRHILYFWKRLALLFARTSGCMFGTIFIMFILCFTPLCFIFSAVRAGGWSLGKLPLNKVLSGPG